MNPLPHSEAFRYAPLPGLLPDLLAGAIVLDPGAPLESAIRSASQRPAGGGSLLVRIPNRPGQVRSLRNLLGARGFEVQQVFARVVIGSSCAIMPAGDRRILRYLLAIRFPGGAPRRRLRRFALGLLPPRWLARELLVLGERR